MKTETEVKHTPTPWEIFRSPYGWGVGKNNSDTEIFYFNELPAAVAKLIELRDETPEQFVRAVNAHDELVAAASRVVERYPYAKWAAELREVLERIGRAA